MTLLLLISMSNSQRCILIFVLPNVYIYASFSILKIIIFNGGSPAAKRELSEIISFQTENEYIFLIANQIKIVNPKGTKSKFLSKPFWFLTISKQGENKTFITNLYYEKIKHKLWHRIIFHGYSNTLFLCIMPYSTSWNCCWP